MCGSCAEEISELPCGGCIELREYGDSFYCSKSHKNMEDIYIGDLKKCGADVIR